MHKSYFLINFLISNAPSPFKATSKDLIPERIYIGGVTQGAIDKKTITDSGKLSFDKVAALKYKITSFKLTLVVHGTNSNIREFENNKDGTLSVIMIDAINQAPAGSRILVEFIRCIDENKISHLVYPVDLMIK